MKFPFWKRVKKPVRRSKEENTILSLLQLYNQYSNDKKAEEVLDSRIWTTEIPHQRNLLCKIEWIDMKGCGSSQEYAYSEWKKFPQHWMRYVVSDNVNDAISIGTMLRALDYVKEVTIMVILDKEGFGTYSRYVADWAPVDAPLDNPRPERHLD